MSQKQKRAWHSLPEHGKWLVRGAIVLSLLIHVGSWLPLSRYAGRHPGVDLKLGTQPQVTVRINPVPPKKPAKKTEDDETKSMVETPMTPTAPPKDPARRGQQDHATAKETRIEKQPNQAKAADAGQRGSPQPATKAVSSTASTQSPAVPAVPPATMDGQTFTGPGTLSMGPSRRPKSAYEQLLPTSQSELAGQVNAGYQEHLEDDLPVGDRIDINTTNYRYIGYFTGMRKAVELVWVYPGDAVRRGMQGQGVLEFSIAKDGKVSRIRIARTSGYEILDRAFIDAIRLAAPFAPLPKTMEKERLDVSFAFHYRLYSYAGGH